MINIICKYDCCGCTACAAICGKQAITMQADEMGFLYPLTDTSKCVDCGLCDKVCPIIRYDAVDDKTATPIIFALHHRDTDTWHTSSSGGVFAALTEYALKRNGIIYGAEYDEDFAVIHRGEENVEGTLKFRGSKYVQSDISGIYAEIRTHLRNGRFVLFSGTPCQVEGLKGFLIKPYINLLTVDIMCHGVPSPKVFADYVQFIRKNSFLRLTGINMKDKTFGWGYQRLRLFFGTHKSQFNTSISNLWNKIFYSHLATRPSCHKCRFANYLRPGDISIGDFWGIEKSHPEFFNSEGISLIMLNNQKGKDVWEHIKDCFSYIESDTTKCVQPNLQHPAAEPSGKQQFVEDYQNLSFWAIGVKYFGLSKKSFIKERIYYHLKSFLGK